MKFKRIFENLLKKKEKWIPIEPYIEKDTECDRCEYLQECISNGNVVNCRLLDDTRDHYIKGLMVSCEMEVLR